MKLLAPGSPKELVDRSLWFKTANARKLSEKYGVEFGFELKGPTEAIRESPGLYWGLHLPDMLATDWYYHQKRREKMFKELKRVAKIGPNYAVLHGTHLLWQPPTKEYIQRYVDRSSTDEYFKILKANIELIGELKRLFNLKIENFPLYFYYKKTQGGYLPYTFLMTGIGRLDDLAYLKEKTGVDIMFDIDHMQTVLNFLLRKRNYRHLPLEKIEKLSADEKKLKDIFGFYLKKNYIPYLDHEVTLAHMINKLAPKFFHVTGALQDIISGKKIVTHAPIRLKDKTFRKNIRLVLAQKPEAILVETANSKVGNAWNYLRPNETELSFYNLCQILFEEL